MRRVVRIDDARCYGCGETIRLHLYIWSPEIGRPRLFHKRCKLAYLEGFEHGGTAADRRQAPTDPATSHAEKECIEMEKFRKRPVVIEAVQYVEYENLVDGMCDSMDCLVDDVWPHVHTIHEGSVVAVQVGDWIIPEPDGKHFYPCKPDIFEKTYERVAPSPSPPTEAQR